MKFRSLPLRPWLFAVLLAFGVGFAWAVLVLWVCNVGHEILEHEEYIYENLNVAADGTPFISRTTSDEVRIIEHFTLDGEELEIDENTYRGLAGGYSSPRPAGNNIVSRTWWQRIRSFNDGEKVPIYWYCIHDGHADGSAYFVGYDSLAKRQVGFIGSNGFTQTLPGEANRFPIRLLGDTGLETSLSPAGAGGYEPSNYSAVEQLYFLAAGKVIGVSLKGQSVETVWEDAEAFHVAAIGPAAESLDFPPDFTRVMHSRVDLLLRRDSSLVVIDVGNGSARTYTIPKEARARHLVIYRLHDNNLLVQASRQNAGVTAKSDLYWIDEHSNITREQSLVLKGPNWRTPDAPLMEPITAAISLPVPLAMTVLPMVVVPRAEVQRGLADNTTEARRRAITRWWPIWLATHLASALLATYVWRRHRRYAISGGWIWALMVFAGGLPALIGYLFHRFWPALIACEFCGAKTVVNRECCIACQRTFVEPAYKGIEILPRLEATLQS